MKSRLLLILAIILTLTSCQSKNEGEKNLEKEKADKTQNQEKTSTEETYKVKIRAGTLYGILDDKSSTSKEKNPLCIIVPGSGPTLKDGIADSYKLLAKELSLNNISCFRYDKRGIGASSEIAVDESKLVVEDFISDIEDIIKHFREIKKFSKIILIGHSQGSLFSAISSENQKIDALISLAGAGRPLDEVLYSQIEGNPYNPKEIVEETREILDSLKASKKIKLKGPLLKSVFRDSIQDYMISWIKYDPVKIFSKLNIPVLIVQGKKDVQIEVKDANLLTNASKNAKLVIIDKMSHILKDAPEKDDMASIQKHYTDNDAKVNEELVNSIVEFVNEL